MHQEACPWRTVWKRKSTRGRWKHTSVDIANVPLCMLSLDFQNIFDKITHKYLHTIFRCYGMSTGSSNIYNRNTHESTGTSYWQASKGSCQKNDISFNRTPKKLNSITRERPEHRQVANPMGSHYKRANNETILPNHQGQTDHQNQTNTSFHGNSNSSRQNQGITAPFQNKSPECPCDATYQTVYHLLYDCTKLQREREREKKTYKQHIKSRQVAGE
jgi:hypothetical protein